MTQAPNLRRASAAAAIFAWDHQRFCVRDGSDADAPAYDRRWLDNLTREGARPCEGGEATVVLFEFRLSEMIRVWDEVCEIVVGQSGSIHPACHATFMGLKGSRWRGGDQIRLIALVACVLEDPAANLQRAALLRLLGAALVAPRERVCGGPGEWFGLSKLTDAVLWTPIRSDDDLAVS